MENSHDAQGRVAVIPASVGRVEAGSVLMSNFGLTTALVVLRSGWLIVGGLPTTDGTAATASAGCLIVNNMGQPVETISGGEINGPWDMTRLRKRLGSSEGRRLNGPPVPMRQYDA